MQISRFAFRLEEVTSAAFLVHTEHRYKNKQDRTPERSRLLPRGYKGQGSAHPSSLGSWKCHASMLCALNKKMAPYHWPRSARSLTGFSQTQHQLPPAMADKTEDRKSHSSTPGFRSLSSYGQKGHKNEAGGSWGLKLWVEILCERKVIWTMH